MSTKTTHLARDCLFAGYSGRHKRNMKALRHCPFGKEMHWWLVDSRHKGLWLKGLWLKFVTHQHCWSHSRWKTVTVQSGEREVIEERSCVEPQDWWNELAHQCPISVWRAYQDEYGNLLKYPLHFTECHRGAWKMKRTDFILVWLLKPHLYLETPYINAPHLFIYKICTQFFIRRKSESRFSYVLFP